jgi:hypothetical protein
LLFFFSTSGVPSFQLSSVPDDQDHDEDVSDDDNWYDPKGPCAAEHDKSDDANILLADWAMQYKITHTALNGLLGILGEFIPGLPRRATTLLQTGSVDPKHIKAVGKGEFHYFGLEKACLQLMDSLLRNSICDLSHLVQLEMQFNIDGLPLFKSSDGAF